MNTPDSRKPDVFATFACLGTLLFWSVGPIFIKLLTDYIDLWMQNLLRYSAACIFWLPMLLFYIRTNRIEHTVWRKAIRPAAANIIMQSLWAAAFYYINPAFMILLIKSSIIWIAGFSLIFFPDERPLVKSKRFWCGMALSVIGVVGVMLYKEDFATSKTLTGIALALAAAFGWAVYTITAKIAFKDIDSRIGFSVISIYTVAGLFVLAMIFGKPGECLKMGARPWAYVVISGMLAMALSHVLYYAAMKRIGATIPSLVLLSTPFTVLASSSVIFGESLSAFQWFFGMVLLAGSALALWAQEHVKRVPRV